MAIVAFASIVILGESVFGGKPPSVIANLDHFPTGPTVFPGYMETPGMPLLTRLIHGEPIFTPSVNLQPQYKRATLESIHPGMAAWLVEKKQSELRQPFSAPILSKGGELIPYGENYMIMNLEFPPFAHRYESILFYAVENPYNSSVKSVVKYQTDCREKIQKKSEIHPLLKEYFLLKYIHDRSAVKIVPEPFFVSPPVRLGATRNRKTDFTMPDEVRARCAASHVRYLVMESGGVSLEDIISFCPNYTLPFQDGMNILKQLLTTLKIIHNMGIIHGDIHRGNVVRSLQDGNKTLLIDFGMSRFVNIGAGELLSEEPIRNGSLSGVRIQFSHWSYGGFTPSYRDDVLGALIAVALSTGGVEYTNELFMAENRGDPDFFIALYSEGDLFEIPGTTESIVHQQLAYLDVEHRDNIIVLLARLQASVRSLDSVNTIPPHDALIDLVDRILELL